MPRFLLTEKNLEFLNPQKSGIKSLLIFLFAILILGSAYSFTSRDSSQSNIEDSQQQKSSKTLFSPISPHVLVYGTWSKNLSYIKGYDLSAGKTYALANLPANIKKASILSPNELIYIANTNDKDSGTEIAVYNISTKQSKTIFRANKGFGIDDYVLSANKKFLVDWEVSFLQNSNVLKGGKSQIYSIQLSSPSLKNLIYDETANNLIHYPLGITDQGEIYFDTFLPNSGAGWAYGMNVSNFDGTVKQDLTVMQNGTYGTKPVLSPDGKYLAFGGYEGANGKEMLNGSRRAIVNPNSVEILETQTKSRIKVQSSKYKYSEISWDPNSGNLIFQINTAIPEFYSYSTLLKDFKKLPISGSSSRFISSLVNDKIIFGELNKSLSTAGNLGEKYSFPIEKTFISEQNNTQGLILSDSLIQVISVIPAGFFQGLTGLDTEESGSADNKKTLQLETFTVKANLAKKRLEQQSNYPEPKRSENTPVTSDNSGDDSCSSPECIAAAEKKHAEDCAAMGDPGQTETCMGTPLYLYGTKGQQVKISLPNYVFNSYPFYQNGYNVTLLDNSKMEIRGKVFEKITYDYISAKRVDEPSYGTIVSRENLADVFSAYALKLGLNNKETEDLINDTGNISSPFVFVSFFDDKTSKEILPIEFSPKPDVYINIVFYLKGLNEVPKELPKKPVFEPLPFRYGFTAVEISWIIK